MSDKLYGFFAKDTQTRSLLMTGFFLAGLLAVTAMAALVDERTINGVSVWSKPLKFDLSLIVHSFTLAVFAQQLTAKARTGWLMVFSTGAYALAVVTENVYITIQAMRGRASHFNFETQIESLLYAMMGIGSLLLVGMAIVIGILVWRRKDAGSSGYRLGTIIGCLVGSILTIIYGGYMSFSGSHFVDAPLQSDAGGLPLLGWSTEAADLRPAHFFALHMIQISPLAGWLTDKFMPGLSKFVVISVSLAMAALSTWLFVNALGGNPLPFFGPFSG